MNVRQQTITHIIPGSATHRPMVGIDPAAADPVAGVTAALARARKGLDRLGPRQVQAAVAGGALLVDTRTDAQRREQGNLPGAIVIDRTVLEWRLDPTSPDRIPESQSWDQLIVVVCRQGYSSSFAAAGLRVIGLHRATDMIGGMESWLSAGLPVQRGGADVRR